MAYDIMKVGRKLLFDLANSGVVIPEHYAVENAIKSAFLAIIGAKRPILNVCTDESVTNALLDMVIQGLNPAKKQCSFIPYGNKLTMHRDYFGSMMLAKTVQKRITDIRSIVIHSGEAYSISVVDGLTIIYDHVPVLGAEEIEAVYAIAVDSDSKTIYSDVMTYKEVNAAWAKSKAQHVHKEFPAEMAQKTVIQRLCKKIINTSNDEQLMASVRATDKDRHAHIVSESIDEIQKIAAEETHPKVIDFPDQEEETQECTPSKDVEKQETESIKEESSFSKIESNINSVAEEKPTWS